MTRSYGASRATLRLSSVTLPVPPTVRDPSIQRLSFTCFRLVAIVDREPDDPAFEAIELMATRNVMGVFMRVR
ncbi:MAG: hypothetical protein JWP01_3607 [Myxococcales bacterium]|nr:hypothetical protein [Myxococcales bacterium]